MIDIEKLEKIIEALSEFFPYDIRVDKFQTAMRQIKSRLDKLSNKVIDFMKKERIENVSNL